MAYYDNAPSHKPQGKKSFGREKWVEEGSEYRGARHGGRPSGKRDDNRAYGERSRSATASLTARRSRSATASPMARRSRLATASPTARRSPMTTGNPTSAATAMIAARK